MKIGNIQLKNNLILAPMAGFSTPALRRLAAENGAGLTVTEMVSVKGLLFNNEKTEELLKTSKAEGVISVQLFGNDPNDFYNCVFLQPLQKFDIIDINMGCPVKKIVTNSEGSALIKDKNRAAEIVLAVKCAANKSFLNGSKIIKQPQNPAFLTDTLKDLANSNAKNTYQINTQPDLVNTQNIINTQTNQKAVSVKTRLFEETDGTISIKKTVEFLQAIQSAGADMIALHMRTPSQMYSGNADYSIFSDIKKELSIPMAINGDITNPLKYQDALQTGADFVMIGRGAISNLAIFDLLQNKEAKPCKQLALTLMQYTLQDFGDERAVRVLRKFLPYLLKGARVSKELRHSLNFINSFEELYKTMDKILSY